MRALRVGLSAVGLFLASAVAAFAQTPTPVPDMTWSGVLGDSQAFLTAVAPGWPSVIAGMIAASVGVFVFTRFVRVGR